MVTRLKDDGEVEKYCPGCDEWWPNDKEFYYGAGKGKLWRLCKACYLEKRYPNGRSGKANILKGAAERT